MTNTHTPKMQLSPGDYVTPAFRAEIDAWLIDFFGYKDDAEIAPVYTPIPPLYNDVAIRTPKKKRTGIRTKRTQKPADTESFCALLNGLEDSFSTLRLPTIKDSWLAKKDVTSLKKMGVYIPVPWLLETPEEPTIPLGTALPVIASALFISKKDETKKDHFYPRFGFCIKNARLPENVEQIRGTPYQYGLCFEIGRDEAGKDMPPKTWWAWCWLVVKADGSIVIPHELRRVHTVIKNGRKGKHKGAKLAVDYKQWTRPSLARDDVAPSLEDAPEFQQIKDCVHLLKCEFRQLVIWWAQRKDQWSVGVRKDGNRATFSIAPENTSAYFADRNAVVNVNDKPRKIVHYVHSHTRTTGARVKAHVRGLREFDWKGYHCVVTAPDLKGLMATTINIEPVEIDKDEEDNGTYMSTLAMAESLAEIEDTV